jgi:hypothetical protein
VLAIIIKSEKVQFFNFTIKLLWNIIDGVKHSFDGLKFVKDILILILVAFISKKQNIID